MEQQPFAVKLAVEEVLACRPVLQQPDAGGAAASKAVAFTHGGFYIRRVWVQGVVCGVGKDLVWVAPATSSEQQQQQGESNDSKQQQGQALPPAKQPARQRIRVPLRGRPERPALHDYVCVVGKLACSTSTAAAAAASAKQHSDSTGSAISAPATQQPQQGAVYIMPHKVLVLPYAEAQERMWQRELQHLHAHVYPHLAALQQGSSQPASTA